MRPSQLWIDPTGQNDSDLDSVRDDPRFVAILEHLRARNVESARGAGAQLRDLVAQIGGGVPPLEH